MNRSSTQQASLRCFTLVRVLIWSSRRSTLPHTDQDREILTAEQAAELLQMSLYGVRQLARSRRLPARKVGREWRFLQSELLHWLRSRPPEGSAEEDSAWLGVAADQMADALQDLEGGTPQEVRQEWRQAMARAVRSARYVPGEGLVVES
ncbi:MAG: helix-turn-helix domain-containing protein [Armatimonadetes bacterium]|nr:helix-turn-helix domain-containing protein [Armatimonadota bacterium]